MRNLEVELAGRTTRHGNAITLPSLRLTPPLRLALSVGAIVLLFAVALALGYRGPAMLGATLVGMAALLGGREGIEMSAWVSIGMLPYLVFILLLTGV